MIVFAGFAIVAVVVFIVVFGVVFGRNEAPRRRNHRAIQEAKKKRFRNCEK